MGRKIDGQGGENLDSLFIATRQQVDQIFLVGLAKCDTVEQPLLAQALKPRRVTALRKAEYVPFDRSILELPPWA